MLPYLSLIAIPAILIFASPYKMPAILGIPAFIYYVVFIGTRYDVGPDWWGYTQMAKGLVGKDYSELVFQPEPFFNILFKSALDYSYDLFFINLFAAMVFCSGVFLFCRRLPEPWIGLMAFTSLPVPLIAMSAIRQSIAVGFVLILLATWRRVSTVNKYLSVGFASLFHFSALMNLAFVVTGERLGLYRKIFYGMLAVVFLYYIIKSDQFAIYAGRYSAGGSSVEASGALSHVLVDVVPAIFYLSLRARWRRRFEPDRLFTTFCLVGLLLLPLTAVSSVSASRLSFYFSVIPAVVWSTTPQVFGDGEQSRGAIRAVIAILLLGLFVVWLNFANVGWLYFPYQSFLFEHLKIHPE